jgi:uncharacterized protein (UPF0276 family)
MDVENLYLNAANHGFDPYQFLDALPSGLIKEVHMAGGNVIGDVSRARPLLADSHAYPIPEEAYRLLDRVLERHNPATIVLERDDRLDATDEILRDLALIRSHVDRAEFGNANVRLATGSTD